MRVPRTLALLFVATLSVCVAVGVATAKTTTATPTCKTGQTSTKKKPCTKPVPQNSCTGTTEGIGEHGSGVALGASGATGGLVISCAGYSTGLTIAAPGHTFSKVYTPPCSFPCTSCTVASTTTLTCKLSEHYEKIGIKVVKTWTAVVAWHYAATDEAATNTTNGSCPIPVVVTLTLNGRVNGTKKAIADCSGWSTGSLQ